MPTAKDKTQDTSKDKDTKVEVKDKITGEVTTKSEDKVDTSTDTVVTDSDKLTGAVLAPTARDTSVTPVDTTTLDSPASAKGPSADEIPAPADNTGDLATANLSREAQRPGKRTGTGKDERMIAALLREREGLAAAGKHDRIAQVDEQLQHYGHDPKADARTRLPEGRSATTTDKTTA